MVNALMLNVLILIFINKYSIKIYYGKKHLSQSIIFLL